MRIKKSKINLWSTSTLSLLILYTIFLIIPLFVLLSESFLDRDTGQFTLENFQRFFGKKYYYSTLLNSFKVTVSVTAVAVALGTTLAYFFSRFKIRGAKTLRILIILSSMSAPFVGAYSWILLLGRNGVVTQFFEKIFGIAMPDIYGFKGILLVLSLQLYPLIFLYVSGALSNVDNSLLEASENLGCSGAKRFFKVVVPLILPTVLAGSLLVFMRCFSDFGTPMLIGEGYRTFPVTIYDAYMSELGGNNSFAASIAIIAIILTLVIFLAQRYIANKKAFTMNSINKIRPVQIGGFRNMLIHLYAYLLITLSIAPQVYVIYTSFRNVNGTVFTSGYSLNNYIIAFSKMGNAIRNTIVIPLTALAFVLTFAVFIAYLVVRKRSKITAAIDTVSMIPYIVPGIVVGIALATAFSRPPMVLTGSMTIMVIALIIRRLPYTIRSSVATLQQIPITIEEAALSLGASNIKTFWKITIPMMSAGIISGAILSWITMISELASAILLYTGKTRTLTVEVYTQVLRGNYGVAAALAAILAVLTTLSLVLFNKVNKGRDLSM
ncbi:ABC transporter permease [Spirochaeta isovalerica]|uniref:Iron(III) transport system permease protein n=1 Tax=Spirochaeta isovalerica TaxID=150 RepID=A0A841RAE6_9SPIO|nr:iron ABC transporter permease [Spirochaeta isovalerica]MBB6479899.1 iron(III) transport system permease protein [Spirochaeta isovalerica]